MGEEAAEINDINLQASKFINACHGKAKWVSTTEARIKSRSANMGQNRFEPPKLCSLSLTVEAFLQNAKRTYLQTCI